MSNIKNIKEIKFNKIVTSKINSQQFIVDDKSFITLKVNATSTQVTNKNKKSNFCILLRNDFVEQLLTKT